MSYSRVVQRNWSVYRHIWKGTMLFTFLQPMMFLSAMGLGLGHLVNQRSPRAFEGVSYLTFVATGLLAASCMQVATFESSFPILGKIAWQRNYEAMLATPLGITELLLGELGWIAIRLSMVSGAFMLVMLAFHIYSSPMALLGMPAAVLTGLAFAAAIIAYAATQKASNSFAGMFRFVVTPLFLFSGTFFPISRLPVFFQKLALITPLYHGVTLVRGLVLQKISAVSVAGHLAYLVIFTLIALRLAHFTLSRRLIK